MIFFVNLFGSLDQELLIVFPSEFSFLLLVLTFLALLNLVDIFTLVTSKSSKGVVSLTML